MKSLLQNKKSRVTDSGIPVGISAGIQIPAWQTERANKLHRACRRIQNALAGGETLTKALRRVSRSYHHRALKSDPARRLQLTPPTLRRHFKQWNQYGRSPAALILKYRARLPYIPRPLLIRFVEFCAANRLPSVKVAWEKFSMRKQNAKQTRGISYGQICYSFSAAVFYLMQKQLKAIEAARARLDQLRFKAIADITERLPERPPRRRMKKESNYQI
jgi:hypothetical protein